jgi:hypothetical protein
MLVGATPKPPQVMYRGAPPSPVEASGYDLQLGFHISFPFVLCVSVSEIPDDMMEETSMRLLSIRTAHNRASHPERSRSRQPRPRHRSETLRFCHSNGWGADHRVCRFLLLPRLGGDHEHTWSGGPRPTARGWTWTSSHARSLWASAPSAGNALTCARRGWKLLSATTFTRTTTRSLRDKSFHARAVMHRFASP